MSLMMMTDPITPPPELVEQRPKPPSLKEQALAALGPEPQPKIGHSWDTILNCRAIERHRLVRRALEALDD
jgi:hypothetical protein